MKVILASGSKYRKSQLQQLGIIFDVQPPQINEQSHKDYSLKPDEFTSTLARIKAQDVFESNPECLVIASDQVAYFEGEYLEKSENVEQATNKLLKLQGQSHQLYTSLVVQSKNKIYEHIDITELKMRALTESQIQSYIKKDRSLDCAGGYKFEMHGQFLFEEIKTKDPSSIIGLPMLKLTTILIENGVHFL